MSLTDTATWHEWVLLIVSLIAFGAAAAFAWQTYLDILARRDIGANGVLRRLAWVAVAVQVIRSIAAALLVFVAVHKVVTPSLPYHAVHTSADIALTGCALALLAVSVLEAIRRGA